jgi:hypothetical protein
MFSHNQLQGRQLEDLSPLLGQAACHLSERPPTGGALMRRVVMPVIARGRKATDPRGPSGTQVFLAEKSGGWFTYTLSTADKRTATVRICVHCRNYRGQWKRQGQQTLVYALWGLRSKTTHWVYSIYRTRFGIEMSYRQMNEARIKITTRHPTLRLLFVGVALLLRNV